jgi:hypothetical protein
MALSLLSVTILYSRISLAEMAVTFVSRLGSLAVVEAEAESVAASITSFARTCDDACGRSGTFIFSCMLRVDLVLILGTGALHIAFCFLFRLNLTSLPQNYFAKRNILISESSKSHPSSLRCCASPSRWADNMAIRFIYSNPEETRGLATAKKGASLGRPCRRRPVLLYDEKRRCFVIPLREPLRAEKEVAAFFCNRYTT